MAPFYLCTHLQQHGSGIISHPLEAVVSLHKFRALIVFYLQAAMKAGAAAGFTFDVAAEMSELFRVVLEHPEDRFSEESM